MMKRREAFYSWPWAQTSAKSRACDCWRLSLNKNKQNKTNKTRSQPKIASRRHSIRRTSSSSLLIVIFIIVHALITFELLFLISEEGAGGRGRAGGSGEVGESGGGRREVGARGGGRGARGGCGQLARGRPEKQVLVEHDAKWAPEESRDSYLEAQDVEDALHDDDHLLHLDQHQKIDIVGGELANEAMALIFALSCLHLDSELAALTLEAAQSRRTPIFILVLDVVVLTPQREEVVDPTEERHEDLALSVQPRRGEVNHLPYDISCA